MVELNSQEQITQFVGALFQPQELIAVRLIETWNEDGKKRSDVKFRQWYKPAALIDNWYDVLEQAERSKANVFFGVCPRWGIKFYEHASQIRTVRCLWADLDKCNPDEAMARCAAAGLPQPSIILNSGNGVHLYWLLLEPVLLPGIITPIYKPPPGKLPLTPEAQHIQGILKGLAVAIGADHTFDLSRILRLPGTLNRKDERNGKPPVACRLVELEPGRRYDLGQFERFMVQAPTPSDAPQDAGCDRAATWQPLAGVTLDRLSVADRERWSARLQEVATSTQADRSSRDFGLLMLAQELGLGRDEVWLQVESISKFADGGERYFDNTWENASQKHQCNTSREDNMNKLMDDEAERIVGANSHDCNGDGADLGTECGNDPVLNAARAAGLGDNLRREEPPAKSSSYQFLPLSSPEFATATYTNDWLIKRLLVKGQPGILGGPKKALKTTVGADLAISLGSGKPFLGVFEVSTPRRTAFISGESGEQTLQETFFRICKAKQLNPAQANVWWDFRLPQLAQEEELAELAKGLRQRGIEVVIIDPLYLCLLSGQDAKGKQASNLFDMGPLLLKVAKACLSAGATPLLAAHARKNLASPNEPVELEDLAFSGIQEFARQWLLLNRRAPFVPGSGRHELWMTAGGSSGHGGTWGVNVVEGLLDDNFKGRVWQVEVVAHGEVIAQKQAVKDHKKQETEEQSCNEMIAAISNFKLANGNDPSKSKLLELLGWSRPKFARILTTLTIGKQIEVYQEKYKGGNNATCTAEFVCLIQATT